MTVEQATRRASDYFKSKLPTSATSQSFFTEEITATFMESRALAFYEEKTEFLSKEFFEKYIIKPTKKFYISKGYTDFILDTPDGFIHMGFKIESRSRGGYTVSFVLNICPKMAKKTHS